MTRNSERPTPGGRRELDGFHQALDDCLAALRRREAPTLDPADLSAMPPEDRVLVQDLAGLAQSILARKQSLTFGLEALRDGFAIFDDRHLLVHANKAFRSFFGRTIRVDRGVAFQQLLTAITTHDLVVLDGMDHERWMGLFNRGQDSTNTVTLHDGRVLRWLMRYNALGHLVVLTNDMTSEVRRQHDLERARQQAEAAAAAKTQFLAQMSHEFRTPMNGVIGMAELLCDSGLDPERHRYAETIRNSAEALLGIINDILDYARGRGQDTTLNHGPFDLEALVVEVMTLMQPAARSKGLDLRTFFDPLIPATWVGDSGRLRQVMLNLVGNAVKYTPAGWVRVQIVGHGDALNVLVHDSGPGIPDDKVDEIFTEFSQLNEPGVTGISGSGLGLPITAQLVGALGGRLWVASTPGEGSTFGVRLPMRPTPGSLPAAAVPRPLADGSPAVLAVQENLTLGRHLRRAFAAAGLPLALCSDRSALAARLRSSPAPRLVLLFCNDDVNETQARARMLRAMAPSARLWLMLPASRCRQDAAYADHVVTLPVTHAAMMGAVIDLLAADPADDPAPAPAEEPPLDDTVAAARGADIAGPAECPAGQRAMRVMVADDNATNRLVIEKMLRHCDIELVVARDGRAAVWNWRSRRPDLILMDVSMPQMDGRAATLAIRETESAKSLPRTPIVAVTAAVEDADRISLLAVGMDEVMTKPVRRAPLLDLIRAYAPPAARPPLPETAIGSSPAA